MLEQTATSADTSHHLYPLIGDLGLILMTAGVAVLLFKKIRQPLVLGYLIAGFLAGPHFDFFPSVKDKHNVEVWAEIGVIILLFSLGLEFSFKKLFRVGGSASITALVQISCMIGLGYLTGQLMGWSQMDSIFLGAILSISSTTIIIRAFEEVGVKSQKFAGIVFGTLIIEDIVAILLMVLLSTIAVSQQFSGMELLISALKLLFFLILWFVGGIFFIPTLLKKTKSLLTDETTLIIALALCLMMVLLANQAGFSPALGAFIMGSILAETTKAEWIEHLVKPVKDLFGAVFFVSVGMLLNPQTLAEYWMPVLIITLVTIFGKSLSTTVGAIISGQPLKQSVQAGTSLAQIGEFSFIIATLGMNLNVTSKFLYPIVVAVSAVTTFTTPFLIKSSLSIYSGIEKILPNGIIKRIENYSYSTQSIRSESSWKVFLKANVIQIVIHSVIILAVIILASRYILPGTGSSEWDHLLITSIMFIILLPFLWALALRRVAKNAMDDIKRNRKYRGPVTFVLFIRVCLALFYVGLLLNNFLSPLLALGALAILIMGGLLFPKKLQEIYYYLEKHFIANFNSREISERIKRRNELTPWDVHMAVFEVPYESSLAGKRLYELSLREDMGINIAIIKRGENMLNVPSRNEILYPKDVLYVIGTDEQVLIFEQYLESSRQRNATHGEVVLEKIVLTSQSFIGLSIREAQLREKTQGLVVGIERDNQRILNPESDFILKKNDIVWLVGDKGLIKDIINS